MISNFKHMTYKKIIITIITLVFYYPGFSQPTKNYLTFHIGLQQSNTFTKPFYSFIGDEGGVIYEQLGATFFDFNILYQKQIFKSRFNELLGIEKINQHNSLYDAEITMKLYNKFVKI